MAYIVTRNNKSGYVALVEKRRIPVGGGKTSVRNVGYVCGLGVMTQSEFEEFRDWAHGITHQESRKEAVLACPRVVKKIEKTKAEIAETQQKKTTVKRASRMKKLVNDSEKLKAKEIEREKFRREYEKKHGIVKEDKPKKKVDVKATYKIGDLTKAQELEAEIKTLRGKKADKSLIRERERKIKSILGKKYTSCLDVAIAVKKGEVLID